MHLSRAESARQAFLRAAADIFFEQGYALTSIDALIAPRGGSKRAIYSEFGNKEGLFAAIVTENVEKALLAFTVEDVREWDLRGALMAFGGRLMTTYISPTLLNVYRIAITENVRFPGAGSEIL